MPWAFKHSGGRSLPHHEKAFKKIKRVVLVAMCTIHIQWMYTPVHNKQVNCNEVLVSCNAVLESVYDQHNFQLSFFLSVV